ncbi:MAG: 4-carboxymuconolactone decarboxylase [Gemmobacter sp.]
MTDDLRETGTQTRRRVLGDAHVARSQATATPFDAPFINLITDAAWGHVWSRDTLALRERSMITLALLAGLGNEEEFRLHLRATRNTGATAADVRDVLLHVAIYAGVPRANTAFRIAREIYAELGIDLARDTAGAAGEGA